MRKRFVVDEQTWMFLSIWERQQRSCGQLWSCSNPVLPFLPELFANTSHVYFDGAALIIAFILLGNYLEGRAKLQATNAVFSLMNLQPKTANVVDENGDSTTTPVEDIEPGTSILVKTGQTIPLDEKSSMVLLWSTCR